jgi:hypothetical protein
MAHEVSDRKPAAFPSIIADQFLVYTPPWERI